MAGIKTNERIKIEVETTGLNLNKETGYPQNEGVWVALSPETIDYNLEIGTSERNPISKPGKVTDITTKTLVVSTSGTLDDESVGEKYLFDNFLNLEYFLVRIKDMAYDTEHPKVYVGYFARTDLTFAAAGGASRTWTLGGSAGEYIEQAATTDTF